MRRLLIVTSLFCLVGLARADAFVDGPLTRIISSTDEALVRTKDIIAPQKKPPRTSP